MSMLKTMAAFLMGAAVVYLWIRLIIWAKLKQLERQRKKDALIELHLGRKP